MADGTVAGTSGADTINAGFSGDPDGDKVDGGDAILPGDTGDDDLIEAYGGADTVDAGAGHDEVYGGTGNDNLSGGTGDDTIFGDEGDDRIFLESGDDTAYGGDGADTVFASIGADLIYGGDGNDTLTGGLGNNSLYGGSGDDVIEWTGAGNDTIEGGETLETGGDVLDASGATGNLTLDLSGVSAADPESGTISDGTETATFREIEVVLTGTGADSITGSTVGDMVDAGDGADTLDLGAGDDIASLGGGYAADSEGVIRYLGDGDADTFVFADGDGSDIIQGFDLPIDNGDGTFTRVDRLDVSGLTDGAGSPVTVADVTVTDDGAGNALLSFPNGETLTLLDVDPVYVSQTGVLFAMGIPAPDGTVSGSAGADTIDAAYLGDPEGDRIDAGDAVDPAAGAEDDIIEAGDGNDLVLSGAGDDSIAAGTGADIVDAGAGNDTILGEAGADTIDGGAGADTLFGGDDSDLISFAEGDFATGESGDDTFVLTDNGEAGNAAITIDGGGGGETAGGGDTLRLGHLADLSTLAITATTTNSSGNTSQSGTVTLDDGSVLSFSDIENIICFTPGIRVATAMGLRAVEDLRPGDLVVTRDHGLQPVRWTGRRTITGRGILAPVRITAGVMTGQEADLVVSPRHRMLITGYKAELLFGESEVLAAALHLVDGLDVLQEEMNEVTYIHILFDRHEVIFAEGAATESFHPGDLSLGALDDAAREELFTVFPELRSDVSQYGDTARRCLKRHEAALLRG